MVLVVCPLTMNFANVCSASSAILATCFARAVRSKPRRCKTPATFPMVPLAITMQLFPVDQCLQVEFRIDQSGRDRLMPQDFGHSLETRSASHHLGCQRVPQRMGAAIANAGTFKQVIHAVPYVTLIALLWYGMRLARGIEEPFGPRPQTTQVCDQGLTYILGKRPGTLA